MTPLFQNISFDRFSTLFHRATFFFFFLRGKSSMTFLVQNMYWHEWFCPMVHWTKRYII